MSWEAYIAVASIVISGITALVALRKGKAEANNLDAKTFREYQQSLKEAHENYEKVLNELAEMREELHKLEQEYEKLECHNQALIEQLAANLITPITLEEALRKRRSKG